MVSRRRQVRCGRANSARSLPPAFGNELSRGRELSLDDWATLANTIQSFAVAIGVLSGGVWAIVQFFSLRTISKARTDLEKTRAEIATDKRTMSEYWVVNVTPTHKSGLFRVSVGYLSDLHGLGGFRPSPGTRGPAPGAPTPRQPGPASSGHGRPYPRGKTGPQPRPGLSAARRASCPGALPRAEAPGTLGLTESQSVRRAPTPNPEEPRFARPRRSASDLTGCTTRARARIQVRIERLAAGNAGDVEPVGEGVSELRIDYGSGYRVYFKKRGRDAVILLAGGDKRT